MLTITPDDIPFRCTIFCCLGFFI